MFSKNYKFSYCKIENLDSIGLLMPALFEHSILCWQTNLVSTRIAPHKTTYKINLPAAVLSSAFVIKYKEDTTCA